ncbi:MAG: hypothetical protein ABI910_06900 [Gemmatimonadota bacterium]
MYLLAQRARATNLARFGQHLSRGILDIVLPLAGEFEPAPKPKEVRGPRLLYGADGVDDSPYSDSPYRATA